MKPIPLIHAEHVERIAALLDGIGASAERYLEDARISPALRESPSGFVPGCSAWTLIGRATRGEGLGDHWLGIARAADWRRAAWARPMTRAVTLGDALRTMCASYVRHIPMVELGLTSRGPVTWFWRRRLPDTHGWEGSEPAEQYTLSMMLEAVRAGAGADWLPERLKVEAPATGWTSATNRLPDVRIEHAQPALALAIPTPILSLPVSIVQPPSAAPEGEPPAPDFLGSLRQVLEPGLDGNLPSQELAAETLWTSPRTLRRRIAEEGTSWRAFANELKFERAVKRLRQERTSVREVAEELGYSDVAHFTRFFRRRAGLSPSAWLREVERAGSL